MYDHSNSDYGQEQSLCSLCEGDSSQVHHLQTLDTTHLLCMHYFCDSVLSEVNHCHSEIKEIMEGEKVAVREINGCMCGDLDKGRKE